MLGAPRDPWTLVARSSLLLASFALLAGAGTVPRSALAQHKKASVVPLRVLSDVLEANQADALGKIAEQQLGAYPNLQILPQPQRDTLEILMDLDCMEPNVGCLAKIGRRHQAEQVFFTTVTSDEAGFALEYELIDAAQAARLKGGRFPARTVPQLPAALSAAIEDAFGPLAPPDDRVAFTVQSTVPGAKVSLGDESLGATPVRTKLKPGQYILHVEKKGYTPFRETIFVERGKPFTKVVTLKSTTPPTPVVVPPVRRAVEPPPPEEPAPIYEKWWFWTGIGAIVVAGVTTAIVLSSSSADTPPSGSLILTLDPAQVENDAVFRR